MTSITTYEFAIATAGVARIVVIVLAVVDLVSMMKVGRCGMLCASEFGKSGNPRDCHPQKTKRGLCILARL
jgi:hypothetical protein